MLSMDHFGSGVIDSVQVVFYNQLYRYLKDILTD